MAIVGFLAAEVAMIAAAFGWVAIYSYLINPGHSNDFYEDYAQRNIPYLALWVSLPVFFFLCRWIGLRAPSSAYATALAVFGLFCLTEVATLLLGDYEPLPLWFEAVNFPAKLLSCLLGARAAQPTR